MPSPTALPPAALLQLDFRRKADRPSWQRINGVPIRYESASNCVGVILFVKQVIDGKAYPDPSQVVGCLEIDNGVRRDLRAQSIRLIVVDELARHIGHRTGQSSL